MSRFLLQAIDPLSECIAIETVFEVSDIPELCLLAGIDTQAFAPNGIYDLDAPAVERISKRFALTFDPHSMQTRMTPWHPIYELPYQVHTERELTLMLAGKKPLAVFVETYPRIEAERGLIPETAFQPHVDSGRIVKREQISPPNEKSPKLKGLRLGTRRVLYALPSEQWRIDAYLLLWKTSEKAGWGDGFERMEGSLLGYEDWQNDAYIEWRKKRYQAALTSGKSVPSA